jgi:hypothetical protein
VIDSCIIHSASPNEQGDNLRLDIQEECYIKSGHHLIAGPFRTHSEFLFYLHFLFASSNPGIASSGKLQRDHGHQSYVKNLVLASPPVLLLPVAVGKLRILLWPASKSYGISIGLELPEQPVLIILLSLARVSCFPRYPVMVLTIHPDRRRPL